MPRDSADALLVHAASNAIQWFEAIDKLVGEMLEAGGMETERGRRKGAALLESLARNRKRSHELVGRPLKEHLVQKGSR